MSTDNPLLLKEQLRLVVVRGKKDKKALVGDAEQQALIKAGKDEGEGGEKVLATVKLANVGPGRTATPFRILGDEREPVRGVLLDNITIGTVRGQKYRYENARNVKQTGIRIGTFIEEPDRENKNR